MVGRRLQLVDPQLGVVEQGVEELLLGLLVGGTDPVHGSLIQPHGDLRLADADLDVEGVERGERPRDHLARGDDHR